MSTNPIGAPRIPAWLSPAAADRVSERGGEAKTGAAQSPDKSASLPTAPAVTETSREVPDAMPPAGVDPELWSVLTTEEREFFGRLRDLGPLTYGRGKTGRQAAPPPGGRLDVRI